MSAFRKTLWDTRKLEETLIRKSQAKLRLATINVVTLVGRSAEVTETVRRLVNTVVLQEVHYMNESVKTLKELDFEYRLYWKGQETTNGQVESKAKRGLAKSVMDVWRIGTKILFVDLEFFGKVVTVISLDSRVVEVKKMSRDSTTMWVLKCNEKMQTVLYSKIVMDMLKAR